jgi:hypothetical protein
MITQQPQSRTVNPGSNVTFSVVASAYPAPTYQWRFKGVNIPGASASTYTRSNAQPADAGSYTVVLNNAIGTTVSQAAVLTMNNRPNVVLTGPTNGAGFVAPATVRLAASASDPEGDLARVDFYQGTTLIGSATRSPYGVDWVGVPEGAYTLTAQATDSYGAWATSGPVRVTVGPPTACIAPPGGLAVWWPGDGHARDVVGGNTAEIFGEVTFVAGRVGQAFDFNGTDSGIRANGVATTAVDNWGMAAWVYWRGLVGTAGKEKQTLLYNGHEGGHGYGIIIPEQGLCSTVSDLCPDIGKLVVLYAGVGYIKTGVSLDEQTWNHIAVARETGVLKLYKNGTLVFSAPTDAPYAPSPADGYMAVGSFPGYSVKGLVDEVMFFNTALTADGVRTLFAAGDMGVCNPEVFVGITRPADGTVRLTGSGPPGKPLTLYTSPDLLNWLPVLTVPNPAGSLTFTNLATGASRLQFYKAGRE